MTKINTPTIKYNEKLLKKDKCLINGKEKPLFIGKICKMIKEGTQPRIVILADPGHGKTFAFGRISEILHNEINLFSKEFKPEKQITQDALHLINTCRTTKNKIMIVPDADSVFPSDEYHTPKNKGNRDVIYLSRINKIILGYDAHELSKCDKAIRTNHNIRLVSKGNGDNYEFEVKWIKRENDSLKTEITEKPLGKWKVEKPSTETEKRIEKLDSKEKSKQLEKREDEIKMKREEKQASEISFG